MLNQPPLSGIYRNPCLTLKSYRDSIFFFLNQILRSAPIDRYRLTWMVPALSPCENVGMCFNFIFIIWYAKILPNYSNSRWNRIICQSMLNRCYLFSTKNFVIICQCMCLWVLFLVRYNFSINVLIIWYIHVIKS